MSASAAGLINLRACGGRQVIIGDGTALEATAIGDMPATAEDGRGERVNITLRDVLVVPKLGRNLLSVRTIAAKNGKVSFDGECCTIVLQGRVIKAPAVGRLYELQLRQTEPTLSGLDAEIDRLSCQVTHHARQRQQSNLTGPHRDRPGSWDLSRSAALIRPWPAPVADDLAAVGRPGRREPYRGAEPDLDGGLSL